MKITDSEKKFLEFMNENPNTTIFIKGARRYSYTNYKKRVENIYNNLPDFIKK